MNGRKSLVPSSEYPLKPAGSEFRLSDGEIHYLYWFIQGSMMAPDVRQQLRRAWGFCERHAWSYILVEAAFYRGYMHGAALLYEDLLTSALPAFHLKGPLKYWCLQRSLHPKGPCMMCEVGLGPKTKGLARSEIIKRGRRYWRTSGSGLQDQNLLAKDDMRPVCGEWFSPAMSASSDRGCSHGMDRHNIHTPFPGRIHFSSSQPIPPFFST